MKPCDVVLPPELDELLHEWSRYFKDRHKYTRCASIEGRFNPFAPGSWEAGWGDNEAAPVSPLPEIKLSRVLKTHEAIGALNKAQKWAVTFGYCYPYLERWIVLKAIRKYTGQRFSWNQYLEQLDLGRMRIWAQVC